MKYPLATLAVCLLTSLATAAPVATSAPTDAPAATAAVERGWVAKKGDNICGLRDLNQLSNPAKLNYKRCLAATPEMKKMKSEGIKPSSPEGIQLANAADANWSRHIKLRSIANQDLLARVFKDRARNRNFASIEVKNGAVTVER